MSEKSSALAITFALPQESAPFVARLHGAEKIERGALPIERGSLAANEIFVMHTGVGAQSCEARVENFLKQHRPRMLISSGFAGALDPNLQIGDIVIAENFTDKSLLEKLRGLNQPRAFFGTLTTQQNVAETVGQKSALFRASGALAVDMETAGIAAQCGKFGMPMLSIRAISDTASQRLPVPLPVWFDTQKQKPRIAALLAFLASHPRTIPEFTCFVRGTFRAARALGDCLSRVVETLAVEN
jgi:adenosylhomocysteine nucleosidase